MRKLLILTLGVSILLAGCGRLNPAPTATVTETATSLPPTETATITRTPTITPTFTASPTPTPTWVAQGPGDVQVPILMYHHIAVSPIGSRYYVPPTLFEDELKLLHNWGYTTITTTMLVDAITKGASLPPRPIILTFDDSNEDNYTNAFPIMKKYGFTGVLYVVVDYINTPNYLTTDQIKEMAAAGWEVGSHSETHSDLLTSDSVRFEVVQSKLDLEKMLGVPILTFAYPFGDPGNSAVSYIHFAKYIAAMGATGFTADQGKGNLFLLQRCEIKGWDTVKSITRFLPWHGDPSFLPTDTPTPTPTASRTPIPTYTQYPTSTTRP
ncbi:MAG TPA: polysaccharide deacetylase family protein [Anaerolineales bacterium]|nr:polysaccharide deacetylase family protein [Anaerolineales bacterium]